MTQSQLIDKNDLAVDAGLSELTAPRRSVSHERAEILIDHAMSVCAVISRTFQGQSDTSCSTLKPKLALEGAQLKSSARGNCGNFLAKNLASPPDFKNGRDVRYFIVEAEKEINSGLKKDPTAFFRTWITDVPTHVQPDQIPSEVALFCEKFAYYWNDSKTDPRKFAAWIEHDFNGRIHGLADGCTRFTICMAALVLGLRDLPYPDFKDRSALTANIAKPFAEWFEHYNKNIEQAISKV